jgi:hypothetical protein
MPLPIDVIEEELVALMFEPNKNAVRIEHLRKLRQSIRPKVMRQSVNSNEYSGTRIEKFNQK